MNTEFVHLLESLANGVVIADRAGTILFCNQFLEQMFGYERNQLLGQSVEVFLPVELREVHVRRRTEYINAPETRLMGSGRDLHARRKDGSVFPVEIGLSPMSTPEGLRVVAIVTDITTRKHAEQRSILQRDIALILSKADNIESVAADLLETIAVALGWRFGAFWLMDSEAQALRCTAFWRAPRVDASELEAASRRILFRAGDGLVGSVWTTKKPEWVADLGAVENFWRAEEARAAGFRSIFELPILVGSQMLGVLEFFSNEVRPPDDALVEIAMAVASQIGQFVDRKRSEHALGMFEERYRSLFENAVFGVLRTTVSGELLDANPALAAMLKYDSVEGLLQLNMMRDVYRDPGERRRLIERLGNADRADGIETEWKTRTGEIIQVRLSGRVVRSEDGSVAGFEAIAENITQRKLLEQQYRQAQKMEAIGRLAGGVAHDFNNLLTIIAVSTDSALDQAGSNPVLRETIEEIARASEQGASLVRQLMAFSRTQPQTLAPVDVNEIIRSAQRMLGILAGENARFELSLADGGSLAAIEPSRLEQVLMNLVSNSRDAMPGGGTISITTSVSDIGEEEAALYVGLKPGKHVIIRVADTGHGIPAEIQPHIFEPFFSTKADGRGNGLGLSTVYGIVHQHEGHIICESAAGQGTAFTIFLLAVERAAARTATVHTAVKLPPGRETILLVEDEPALRASIRRILEQNGYKVTVASDGLDALKIAAEGQNRFDLLVTDIALPHIRGTELAERLLDRSPSMKVLYMSGYSEEKLPEHDAFFIPKPFRREALIRKIREVLDA
ncbi:MAG: PAS domain S-box protein [Acidobacteria bacterium]|nr:PAS domain S-box protein [Acidobacteriota bacterium]